MSINHPSRRARVGLVAIVMALVAASWTAIGAQRDGRGTAPAATRTRCPVPTIGQPSQ